MNDPSTLIFLGLIIGLAAFLVTLLNTNAAMTMLIYSMLLSPEIPIAQMPERSVVIRVDDLLLVVVFFTWLAKIAINKQVGLFRATPLNVPITLFLTACLVSTVWGIVDGTARPLQSMFFLLKYVEYFLLYFLMANVIRTREQLERFLKAFLITAACVGLWCYWSVLTSTGGLFGVAFRVSAPFDYAPDGQGEPNTLAAYLMIVSAVCLGITLHVPALSWKRACVGLLCLMALPFLITYSRGGWMSGVVMYTAFSLVSRHAKLPLLTLLLVGIVLIPLVVPHTIVERVAETFRHPIGSLQILGVNIPLSHSPYHRVYVWKFIFEKFMERPLFGFGLTGVGLIDSQYPRMLGELGVVGFLAFGWMLLKIGKLAWRVYHTSPDPLIQGVSVGLFAAFIGLLANCLTGNFFIIVRVMEPFWFLVAIVAISAQLIPAAPLVAARPSGLLQAPRMAS